MKFMHLWPLALLILIPVVIVMYLLKQKAVDMPVPSLFLWKEMYKNQHSDTPWEKLKKNILLIMQIITIIVVVFALMGPYLRKEIDVSESVAILIDNSGSMSAKLSEYDTRLERAKASAVNFVDTLPAGTKITLIECNRETSTLISNSLDKNAVTSLIRGIKQTTYAGNVSGGINTCKMMKAAEQTLQVAAFTDTGISLQGLEGTIYDFSGNIDNACVDYVSCGSGAGKMVVLASISNCGSESIETDLDLRGDNGELLSVQSISLAPGESKVVYFTDISYEGSVVSVEISREDALPTDNIAYGLSRDEAGANVLIMTPGNLYLQRAIELKDGVNVVIGTELDDFSSYVKDKYDLIVFDNCLPENVQKVLPEESNLMFINVPYEEYYTTVKKLIYNDSFVPAITLDENNYTKDISRTPYAFYSVNAMEYPIWAVNLMTVKTDTGKDLSAGFIGEKDGRKICVFGFDLHSSDFVLTMDFPVLMYNLVSELTNTSALSEKSLYCGDSVKITSLNDNGFTVSGPSNTVKNFSSSLEYFKNTDVPGIYTVDKGKDTEESFVVNFPTTESKVVKSSEAGTQLAGAAIVDATEEGVFSFRPLIIGLIVLLLIAEWIIFIRK